MVADGFTFSRILFSLILLVLSPYSVPFGILYLLCGISDVLDGFAARKLHTESEKGAKLDSAADLVFAAVYAVKILPVLHIPLWIRIWTAIIAGAKVTGIVLASRKAHRFQIGHSTGNKLTGLFLFFLPFSLGAADGKYGASLVCLTATITVLNEIIHLRGGMKHAL